MITKEIIVKNEIDEFKHQIERFLSGTINEDKFKSVRLAHGIYGQRQPGFYMIRTKLPQGKMFDYQIERISDIVQQYARGLAHLTTRHDIQMHWVDLKNVPDVLYSLAEVGITTRESCGNAVRNVTACPYAGICAKEIFDISNIAHNTTLHFLRNPISQNLPRKFKISFNGCEEDCSYSRINDIGFIAVYKGDKPGFRVYVGGGLGGHPRNAYLLKDFIPVSDVLYYTDAIVRVFDRHGNRNNRNKARLKYLIEEMGFEEVSILIDREYSYVKEIYADQKDLDVEPIDRKSDNHEEAVFDDKISEWIRHYAIKQRQEDYYAVVINIPYGDITAKQLKDIAKLSQDYGSGELRTTLDQNFVIPWVKQENLNSIYREINDLCFYADTSTCNIVSCPGAKTCNLGIARSQSLSMAIHDRLKTHSNVDLSDITIRVCGCPNSCAQHWTGNIGFSGLARRVGEKHAPFYQVYLGGHPNEDGFSFAKPFIKVPAKNVPALTEAILESYTKTNQKNETFNSWVNRYEKRLLEDVLTYSYLPEYERSPEFYYDYGMDEPFSIKDIGKGECAGGVVDMIEIYLNRAETKAMDANTYANRMAYGQSLEQARFAITYAIQSLLIMKGIDPESTTTDDMASHVEELKQEHIIDDAVANIYKIVNHAPHKEDAVQIIKDVMSAIHSIRKSSEAFDEALLGSRPITGINKVEVKLMRDTLDLKGVKCPFNYVKAKLKLEELTSGDELEVYLDEGEPIENVPRSIEDDGNSVLSIDKVDDTHYRVVVKKA